MEDWKQDGFNDRYALSKIVYWHVNYFLNFDSKKLIWLDPKNVYLSLFLGLYTIGRWQNSSVKLSLHEVFIFLMICDRLFITIRITVVSFLLGWFIYRVRVIVMVLKDQYFSIFITWWSLQRAVCCPPGVKNERTNNDSGSSLNENSYPWFGEWWQGVWGDGDDK